MPAEDDPVPGNGAHPDDEPIVEPEPPPLPDQDEQIDDAPDDRSEALERLAAAMAILENDGAAPGCPLTPLGVSGEIFFVLDSSKQVFGGNGYGYGRNVISGLCALNQRWLYDNYPQLRQVKTKDGKDVIFVPKKDTFKPDVVADKIFKACSLMGQWAPLRSLRGRGASPGDTPDTLVTHLGNSVLVGNRSRVPGRHGPLVYAAGEALPPPASEAQDTSAGRQLGLYLADWHYRGGMRDWITLCGWVGQSWIAGALPWRSHVWCLGERGVGKSSLLDFVDKLHESASIVSVSDTTNAGLWQALKIDSICAVIDELENDPLKAGRIADLIGLMRRSSMGAAILRGTKDHRHLEFRIRSAFLCAAISMPDMPPQDLSRQLQVEVVPSLKSAPQHRDLDRLGRRLHRRMRDQFARLVREVLPAWKRELVANGWDNRGADTVGTLLACNDVLIHDALEREYMASTIAAFLPGQVAEQQVQLTEWRRLLIYCATSVVGDPEGMRGERISVGALTVRGSQNVRARDDDGELDALDGKGKDWSSSARQALANLGLRLWQRGTGDSAEWWLSIANSHRGLQELLRGSPWQGTSGQANVRSLLLRVPRAEVSPTPERFGQVGSRAVRIPLCEFLNNAEVVQPDAPMPEPRLQPKERYN